MKTTKNTKKVKKVAKPAFIVDITDCETATDVIVEIALAKVDAGIAITVSELEAILFNEIEFAIEEYENELKDEILVLTNIAMLQENKTPKKPNVFKRFWNWITRK